MEEEHTESQLNALIAAVKLWGKDKNLHDPIMQFAKMNEEVGGIAHELTRGHYNSDEMVDAIGDTFVTLIILADILNIDLYPALHEAYTTISTRKGATVNGSFVKEDN